MREFITLLTAIVVLAVIQAFTTALGIVLLLFALMGAVAYPRQTFGLIAALGLLVLAAKRPACCVAALGAVGVAAVLADGLRRHWSTGTSIPPSRLLTHTGTADEPPAR